MLGKEGLRGFVRATRKSNPDPSTRNTENRFGLGFGVWGLGFGVWGLGFRV